MGGYNRNLLEDILMLEILYLFLGIGAALLAYRAMLSKHLLPTALYLAGVSALVTMTLYLLGQASMKSP